MVTGQAFVVGPEKCILLWLVSCLSFAIVAKLTCLV